MKVLFSPRATASSCRAQAAARMLIASYFIAYAMGVVVAPSGIAFLPPPETATVASWAASVVIGLLGAAMFVGRMVRSAALVIGLYTIGTALWTHGGLSGAPVVPGLLWTQLAMTGGLALVALGARAEQCSAPCPRRVQPKPQPTRVAEAQADATRRKLELAATRAALAEIQASDNVVAFSSNKGRRSA